MKTNKSSASMSTELTDATATIILTSNLDNPMDSINSVNNGSAINHDNLFDNDATQTELTPQPKQQRIGKQQRKSDFSDFKESFLQPSKLMKRHSVNIEESVWEQLKTYASDIDVWRSHGIAHRSLANNRSLKHREFTQISEICAYKSVCHNRG